MLTPEEISIARRHAIDNILNKVLAALDEEAALDPEDLEDIEDCISDITSAWMTIRQSYVRMKGKCGLSQARLDDVFDEYGLGFSKFEVEYDES